ncbi:MAG: hypothetical protein ACUZ8N_12835 [Candidatus Scalindua sp.]
MGTSTSHPSPKNSNWKPVSTGYQNKNIPIERVISEVWRASENQENPISEEISSDIVFKCQGIIKDAKDVNHAINNYNKEILKTKSNSIIVEFAKRAIPAAMKSDERESEWRSSFFSEVTSYIVSRDASGYVGKGYRNKSVNELINFKNSIKENVRSVIKKIDIEPKNKKQWRSYVKNTIRQVKEAPKK